MKASLTLCIMLMLCGQIFATEANFVNITQNGITEGVSQGNNSSNLEFSITVDTVSIIDSLEIDYGIPLLGEVAILHVFRGVGANRTFIKFVPLYNIPPNVQKVTFSLNDILLLSNQAEQFSVEAYHSCTATLGLTYTPKISAAKIYDDNNELVINKNLPLISNKTTIVENADPLIVRMLNESCEEKAYLTDGNWIRLNSYIEFITGNTAIFLEDFVALLYYYNNDYNALKALRLYNEQNQLVYESTVVSGVISFNNINILFEERDTQNYYIEVLEEEIGHNKSGFPSDDIQITVNINPGETYEINCGQDATIVHESANINPLRLETYRSLAFATSPVGIQSLQSVASGGGFQVVSSLVPGIDQTLKIIKSEVLVNNCLDYNQNNFVFEWKSLVEEMNTNADIASYDLYDENGLVASTIATPGGLISFNNLSLKQNQGSTKFYAIKANIISIPVNVYYEMTLDNSLTTFGTIASNDPYFISDGLRICDVIKAGLCPVTIDLSGTKSGVREVKASQIITSEETISQGDHFVGANEYVLLKEGFCVNSGATLHATIEGCSQ